MKNAAAQFVGEPTQTFAAEPVSEAHNCIRAIVGASSGNLVEWYDFYAYAFTSIYFASTFFPSGDGTGGTACFSAPHQDAPTGTARSPAFRST